MTSVLAIAQLTCRAVWRLRAGWLLLALLAVVIALPVSWSIQVSELLGPGQALLIIAALWMACDLASREFDEQTILVLAVRPISPTKVLLGRWLGLLACELPLLLLVAIGVLVRVPHGGDGWIWYTPQVPDFVAEADRRLAGSEAYQAIGDPVAKELQRRELIGELRAAWQTVAPGEERTWQLGQVEGGRAYWLKVQPFWDGGTSQPRGRVWVLRDGVSDRGRPLTEHGNVLEQNHWSKPRNASVAVRLTNEGGTPLYVTAADGLRFGMEVTSFRGNLARAMAVIAGQVALMNALGLLLGSALSFPVAAFCGLAYLSSAWLVGLVAGRLRPDTLLLGRQALTQPWLEQVSQVALRTGYGLTAAINAAHPASDLSQQIAVPMPQVYGLALGAGLGGSLILLGAGGWILRRRELGGATE